MSFIKSYITKYTFKKGKFIPIGRLYLMFNPTKVKINSAAGFADKPGGGTVQQNTKKTIEFSMNLNITSHDLLVKFGLCLAVSGVSGASVSTKGVSACESFFDSCIKTDQFGPKHMPDYASFNWGANDKMNFIGYLSYTVDFDEFNSAGIPLSGTYSIKIREVGNRRMNVISAAASPDRSKCKMIQSGVSIWDIARNEYNDEDQWRKIAMSNNIADPLDIVPGKIVKVPPIV